MEEIVIKAQLIIDNQSPANLWQWVLRKKNVVSRDGLGQVSRRSLLTSLYIAAHFLKVNTRA